MDVGEWYKEVCARVQVQTIIDLVKSYVYIPPHESNVQDTYLLDAIEQAFKTRVLPCDQVIILYGDVQFASITGTWVERDKTLQSAILHNGTVFIASKSTIDHDAMIHYDRYAQIEIPGRSDSKYHTELVSPRGRLNNHWRETLGLVNDCTIPQWLVLRTRVWIDSTSARRSVFFCLDERRFRCNELSTAL